MATAIDRKWDDRLYNWALWYVGAADGICSASSAYNRLEDGDFRADGDGRTWEGYTPQALIGEALDTNELILQLKVELFEALRAWYCWTGTEEQRALDLGVPRSTLRSRVVAAKVELERLDGIRRRALPYATGCARHRS